MACTVVDEVSTSPDVGRSIHEQHALPGAHNPVLQQLGAYIAVAWSRAIDKLLPMCTPNISSAFWSKAVKCPTCLFRACSRLMVTPRFSAQGPALHKLRQLTSTTAIILPDVSLTGQHSTDLVLNPVSLSTSE